MFNKLVLDVFYFFSSDVGILGLLFTSISPVHGIVFLKLHGLHLLLDGIHCDGRSRGLFPKLHKILSFKGWFCIFMLNKSRMWVSRTVNGLGQKFTTWVGSGQPHTGPENFPPKYHIFQFVFLRVKKRSYQVWSKIPRSKPGGHVIYCSQKYARVGSNQGPSLF